MAIEFIRAICAGILAALPIGPVLLLVISNTTSRGKKAGVLCALGCMVLDTSYATLSVLALGFIQSFISQNETILMIFGSAILITIGLLTIFRKESKDNKQINGSANFVNCSLKTFLTGLSNPAAFAIMLAIMASLNLGAAQIQSPVWVISLGVALGEAIYWSLIIFVVLQIIHFNEKVKQIINYVAGAGIVAFGVIMIIRALLM